jgi:ribosomal protein L21E
LFSKLARYEALVPDTPDVVWVPLESGLFSVGDKVRVKSDAFKGDLGLTHNGRTGVIVGIRRGDVIVDIRDGKTPELSGFHYRPHHLEGQAI